MNRATTPVDRARPTLRRRAADALFILTVVGAAAAIAGYVHTAMKQVREGLPAQVLEQQRDIAYMVNELAGTVHAVERARAGAEPGRLEAVRVQVRAARRRLDGIRRTYNFDNLVGASAVHAIANPALMDLERWSEDGLSGRPPSSAEVLELMRLRAENAYERVSGVFDEVNRTAAGIVRAETARLERFRASLFAYLAAFAALVIGVSVLFVRQRNAEARLARERKRLVDSIERITEGFALYDRHDRLVLFNRRFREIVPQHEGLIEAGRTFEDVLRMVYGGGRGTGRSGPRLEAWVAERLERHRDPHGPFELRLPDGRVLQVSEQRTDDGGTVGVYTDITEQKRVQERLEHLATHDPLTGLPNRGILGERVEQAIARCNRSGQRFAVMFFDLDHFKRVNDTLGHAGGDRLLRRVAENLQRCLRENDTVVRLGGDEFAAVVEDVRSWSEIAATAERALGAVREAVDVAGSSIAVTTSIGVAIHPEDGADAPSLLRNADAACYDAKRSGRDNYQFFTERLNAQASERLGVESRVRAALEADQLVAHYRPRIDIASGALVGLEAAIRWRDPALADLTAERIAPVAAESGLAVEIGERMLALASADSKTWVQRGLPEVSFGVTLAPRQFRIRALGRVVGRIVSRAGIAPARLALSVRESTFVEGHDDVLRALEDLRGAGHPIYVDGFGAGYSSLASLKLLPLDGVRIDASLVGNLAEDADDEAIISAIASLAHRLGRRVIATGVETREQMLALAALGCDEVEGSLLGTPRAVEEAAVFATGVRDASVTPIERGARRRSGTDTPDRGRE